MESLDGAGESVVNAVVPATVVHTSIKAKQHQGLFELDPLIICILFF